MARLEVVTAGQSRAADLFAGDRAAGTITVVRRLAQSGSACSRRSLSNALASAGVGLRELRSREPRAARFCAGCGAACSAARRRELPQGRDGAVLRRGRLDGAWASRLIRRRCGRCWRRYFERMRGIVESHGGTVEKFIGDAVMAVFGVPVVHEDDALRACRAAVEMRDALAGARASRAGSG